MPSLTRPLTDAEVAQALAHLDAVRTLLSPPAPPPPPGDTLRIVHWNTHHGGIPVKAGVDQKLNVQGITDWLVRLTPDLVSLNELEENDGYGQLDQLEAHRAALETAQGVPWVAAFVSYAGSDKRQGGGQGLLSKTTLGPSLRKGLSAGRSVGYLPIDAGVGLLSTHLSNTSAVDRATQVNQLLVWQRTLGLDRALLCGDFNAVPGAAELDALKMTGLYQDAWVEATGKGTATSFTPDGATRTHRIDYVWVRGFDVLSVDVPDTSTGGVFPSDHHPVVVVVRPLP